MDLFTPETETTAAYSPKPKRRVLWIALAAGVLVVGGGAWHRAAQEKKHAAYLASTDITEELKVGAIAYGAQDCAGALPHWQRAIDSGKLSRDLQPKIWLNKGYCEFVLGQNAAATASFNSVLAIDPSNEEAKSYLAMIQEGRRVNFSHAATSPTPPGPAEESTAALQRLLRDSAHLLFPEITGRNEVTRGKFAPELLVALPKEATQTRFDVLAFADSRRGFSLAYTRAGLSLDAAYDTVLWASSPMGMLGGAYRIGYSKGAQTTQATVIEREHKAWNIRFLITKASASDIRVEMQAIVKK